MRKLSDTRINTSESRRRPVSLPKSSRLRKRSEFRRVYDQGSRVSCALFTLYYLRQQEGSGARVGFTTPRALGPAVVRNRIRRRMREAVRLALPGFQHPIDLVFHPRRTAAEAGFETLRGEVVRILPKCLRTS